MVGAPPEGQAAPGAGQGKPDPLLAGETYSPHLAAL